MEESRADDREFLIRTTPFMDIPIVEAKEPTLAERFIELVEWADNDKDKLSAGFLAYRNNGDNVEDYLFQIAFILNGCLATNKAVIEETGVACKEYNEWKRHTRFAFAIERHLELYYEKIKCVPPWGSAQYRELLQKGHTPRVLEGPHKVGGLKPNQKRKVVLDTSNNIVFGPLLTK